MSIDKIVCGLGYLFVVTRLVAGSYAKQSETVRHKQMRPSGLACRNMNLQRTLVWASPLQSKRNWELQGYKVKRGLLSESSFQDIQCYSDEFRTHPITKLLSKTSCLMSSKGMSPWNLYIYKVFAVYRNTKNRNKTLTASNRVACEPIERRMSLGAPHFDQLDSTTSTISFHFKLPAELENAIEAVENYDLRITYSYCLTSGDECQGKDMINDSCNPSHTYTNLKEGVRYNLSVWYTTHAGGNEDTSEKAVQDIITKIDLFPPRSQIILVIGLSVFCIMVVIGLVVWRTTRSVLHKWDMLVNKEMSKYFEEALKDISKSQKAGFVNLIEYKCHEELLDIPRMVIPVTSTLLQKVPQCERQRCLADQPFKTYSVHITRQHSIHTPSEKTLPNKERNVIDQLSVDTTPTESWSSTNTLPSYVSKCPHANGTESVGSMNIDDCETSGGKQTSSIL